MIKHNIFRDIVLFKGTEARDFCFLLRMWGFGLGPTDVTHPLLNLYTVPLIFYDLLKMAPI